MVLWVSNTVHVRPATVELLVLHTAATNLPSTFYSELWLTGR